MSSELTVLHKQHKHKQGTACVGQGGRRAPYLPNRVNSGNSGEGKPTWGAPSVDHSTIEADGALPRGWSGGPSFRQGADPRGGCMVCVKTRVTPGRILPSQHGDSDAHGLAAARRRAVGRQMRAQRPSETSIGSPERLPSARRRATLSHTARTAHEAKPPSTSRSRATAG